MHEWDLDREECVRCAAPYWSISAESQCPADSALSDFTSPAFDGLMTRADEAIAAWQQAQFAVQLGSAEETRKAVLHAIQAGLDALGIVAGEMRSPPNG